MLSAHWNFCLNNPFFPGYFDRRFYSVCLNNDTRYGLKSDYLFTKDECEEGVEFTPKINDILDAL